MRDRKSWISTSVLMLCLVVTAGCKGGGGVPGLPGGPAGAAGPGGMPVAGQPGDVKKLLRNVTSYELVSETQGHQTTVLFKFKDGEIVRMKVQTPGGGWMLMMKDKGETYMYNPSMKAALKMADRTANEGGPAGPVPEDLRKMSEGIDPSAKGLGSEVIDGADCWVYEVSVPGHTSKSWIDKQYGLPRRHVSGTLVINYKYNRINAVPDAEFELPPGVAVKDMTQMGGMSGMPAGAPDLPGEDSVLPEAE
jgi:outer membrane lipoprotein-sorting protein